MIKLTIRERRKKKKLSQLQLAQLLNVDQTAISQWETNRTRPSLENLVQLSNIFNCEIKDLINNEISVKKKKKMNLNKFKEDKLNE